VNERDLPSSFFFNLTSLISICLEDANWIFITVTSLSSSSRFFLGRVYKANISRLIFYQKITVRKPLLNSASTMPNKPQGPAFPRRICYTRLASGGEQSTSGDGCVKYHNNLYTHNPQHIYLELSGSQVYASTRNSLRTKPHKHIRPQAIVHVVPVSIM
jgi:hypothetical protein